MAKRAGRYCTAPILHTPVRRLNHMTNVSKVSKSGTALSISYPYHHYDCYCTVVFIQFSMTYYCCWYCCSDFYPYIMMDFSDFCAFLSLPSYGSKEKKLSIAAHWTCAITNNSEQKTQTLRMPRRTSVIASSIVEVPLIARTAIFLRAPSFNSHVWD